MSKKVNTWRKINSKQIADCRVFKVREDVCESSADNRKANFFIIENPDWVNIIALTKDEKVVLIEQFRHGTQEITLEIPGGMIDEVEEPKECARRELLEETGFTAEKIICLGKSFPNPALQQNKIFHFLALNCEKTGKTKFDAHESISTKLVDLKEIPVLIETEKIDHSLVIAGFYRLERYLENNILYES